MNGYMNYMMKPEYIPDSTGRPIITAVITGMCSMGTPFG